MKLILKTEWFEIWKFEDHFYLRHPDKGIYVEVVHSPGTKNGFYFYNDYLLSNMGEATRPEGAASAPSIGGISGKISSI